MGRAKNRSILSQSIAEILGTAEPAGSAVTRPGPFRKSLVYSSIALLAINPAQVNAVGLGELNVHSRLGQPLDATVPITLAPGESLPKNCVAPTRGTSGFSVPKNIRVSTPAATQPGTYNLRVTTANALHEPMYEISLLINCPGTPILLRQYVLMLDLPGMTVAVSPQTAPAPITGDSRATGTGDALATPAARAQTTAPMTSPRSAGDVLAVPAAPTPTTSPATNARTERSLQQTRGAIQAGGSYRVRRGDTLSTIAARIEGREPDTTWSVANLIFAANAHAFIRNNPDLIKLGSRIDIPAVAELAGLRKGRTAVATVTPATTPRETFSEPQPAPTPAPIRAPVAAPATTSRPETFASEPEPKQPEATTAPNADDTEAPIARPDTTPVAELTNGNDAAVISPFVDEELIPIPAIAPDAAPEIAAVVAVAEEVSPVPVVTTTDLSEPSKSFNPLLAILGGLLLGVFITLIATRRKWFALMRGLSRRKIPVELDHDQTGKAEAVDASRKLPAVSTAFEAQTSRSTPVAAPEVPDLLPGLPGSHPLPIGNPAENTYIVETSPMDSTAALEARNLVESKTTDFAANTLDDIGDEQSYSDEALLSELFENDSSIVEESDAEIFDPTAQLPVGNPDLMIDATVEMPVAADPSFDPSLTNSADETVEQVSAAELFAADNDLDDDFFDASPTTRIPAEPTLGDELDALPLSDEDDMSETLYEAMSLLERDFEDEFTASQILERSEITKSLDDAEADDTEATGTLERKVGG